MNDGRKLNPDVWQAPVAQPTIMSDKVRAANSWQSIMNMAARMNPQAGVESAELQHRQKGDQHGKDGRAE